MKSVILIRHVKSDHSNMLADIDRPIRNDRKEDAKEVAKDIKKRGDSPQHLICSPAKRTLQTASLLAHSWDYPEKKIAIAESLYECTANDILNLIKNTDEKFDTIAIVCHNPAITDFVNQYSDARIDNVPTTGAVKVDFGKGKWKEIKTGKLNWFLSPKQLKAAD